MFQLSNTDGKPSGSAMNWSLGTLYPLEGQIGWEILEVGLLRPWDRWRYETAAT